ncbi:RHS repeat-associated core domain-containing protein [Xenorhabdus vietnamensis]|uniref:RHS repeat-associated core domain-containing protein n=1 Tax=Xenorhabdus vietnamensis TaxID=351656 RepID=A0A1Y2S9K3_9GAMM|nr:hypothetical protein [Xenorhabdus vietnamensis]OTA14568.1 RHS repeat-associated core domain-containing protein [Xenorhabdus vietnamensis]
MKKMYMILAIFFATYIALPHANAQVDREVRHTYELFKPAFWKTKTPKSIPLPKKINLTKSGLKHVEERHIGYTHRDWRHKSKWTVNKADIKTIARDIFRHPNRIIRDGRNNNFIYEKVLKKIVGIDSEGNKLKKARVVIKKNGDLVTAFPELEFKKVGSKDIILRG